MRFSAIFTVLATSSMVLAGAVPEIIAKRDVGDVENVFSNLGTKLDAITPEFSNCKDDTCTASAVNDIVSAINDQTANLSNLSCGSDGSGVAPFVADVINKIAPSLSSHKDDCGSSCPGLNNVYPNVDSALASFLKKALDLCPAVPALLPNALANLKPTLQSLGFTSTLSACGLS